MPDMSPVSHDNESSLEMLVLWLNNHLSHVTYVTPNSKNYAEFRDTYIIQTDPIHPLAIVRPRSTADVAQIVSFAVSNHIAITVRSGGHDLYGRCFVDGALAIDMREIAFVDIEETRTTAAIGGGILAGDLAAKLSAQGLATAYGSSPSVGYVGWATHGGYGALAANYGLGVDQIVGAEVVNWEGRVVDADELMLRAIRGEGGVLGVICKMTIRVYPLKQILGGIIAYETINLTSILKSFNKFYQGLETQGLSPALGIQRSIVNTPSGITFAIGFVWSSDDTTKGRKYLDKFCNFAKPVLNTVTQTTFTEWMDNTARLIPSKAYGATCSITIRELTDEVISIIDQEVAKMPSDPATLCSIHHLRACSPSSSSSTQKLSNCSVFAAREEHFVFEFIATASTAEQAEAAWKWATEFRAAMQYTSDQQNILPYAYIALTPPGDSDFPSMFGLRNWESLKAIKKKYDPNNVFRHALPQFDQTINEPV